MNLDKMMMIVYAIIVVILIIGVVFMGGYGSTISKDPNFVVFFSWFIGLLLLNLFKYSILMSKLTDISPATIRILAVLVEKLYGQLPIKPQVN